MDIGLAFRIFALAAFGVATIAVLVIARGLAAWSRAGRWQFVIMLALVWPWTIVAFIVPQAIPLWADAAVAAAIVTNMIVFGVRMTRSLRQVQAEVVRLRAETDATHREAVVAAVGIAMAEDGHRPRVDIPRHDRR